MYDGQCEKACTQKLPICDRLKFIRDEAQIIVATIAFALGFMSSLVPGGLRTPGLRRGRQGDPREPMKGVDGRPGADSQRASGGIGLVFGTRLSSWGSRRLSVVVGQPRRDRWYRRHRQAVDTVTLAGDAHRFAGRQQVLAPQLERGLLDPELPGAGARAQDPAVAVAAARAPAGRAAGTARVSGTRRRAPACCPRGPRVPQIPRALPLRRPTNGSLVTPAAGCMAGTVVSWPSASTCARSAAKPSAWSAGALPSALAVSRDTMEIFTMPGSSCLLSLECNAESDHRLLGQRFRLLDRQPFRRTGPMNLLIAAQQGEVVDCFR